MLYASGRAARGPLLRGSLLCAIGSIGLFLLMSYEGRIPRAALFGLPLLLLTVGGLLEALRLWPSTGVEGSLAGWFRAEGEPLWMAPMLTLPLAALVGIVGALTLGAPAMPALVAAMLALLSLSAWHHPHLRFFVLVSWVYLPLQGVMGLWDPWETHYGEVAREILARNDWISLWWAQEAWFWSKPIFIFWSEALSMSLLGIDPRPDAHPAGLEWAIRLPIYCVSVSALFCVATTFRRIFGAKAAWWVLAVLGTMPLYFCLSRQSITDMPFVGNMTMAMCMLFLALSEPEEREAQVYRLGPFRVSVQSLLIAAICAVALPQIFYLVSRNLTLTENLRFHWHRDVFFSGSAGNDQVPGNPVSMSTTPHLRSWPAQPIAQAGYWALGLALIVYFLRKERRTQSLAFCAFYFFAALAFMAKGIPGFALPGISVFFYLCVTRRWAWLGEGRFRIALGSLIVLVVGMPWVVAMTLRHGAPFLDRLLVHDHVNRLASGVHGESGSIRYFIEQLGYATFPWAGLLPIALLAWTAGRAQPKDAGFDDGQRSVLTLIALWFLSAFTLFSAMATKFHHYIFPVVPPAAMLIAIFLHRLLENAPKSDAPARQRRFGAWIAGLGGGVLSLFVASLYGNLRGIVPEGVAPAAKLDWVMHHAPPLGIRLLLGVLTLGALAYAYRASARSGERHAAHSGDAIALLISACVLAFVGRDVAWATGAAPEGYEHFAHMFIYMYERPWPSHIDYRPLLHGFAIAGTLLLVAAAFLRLRRVALQAFLGMSLLFATWTLNVYLKDLAPHWSQKYLIDRYYAQRQDASEPLVAWQMNWKGENLYTGNRVAVFADLDNRKLMDWVKRNQGKRAFFIFEHFRMPTFESLMHGRKVRALSSERDNNKFILMEVRL